MKPGLTKRNFDGRPLVNSSRKLVNLFLQAQSKTPQGEGVLINPFILRYAISVMGQSFLDIDFRVRLPLVPSIALFCTLSPWLMWTAVSRRAEESISEIQMTIKQSIFKPLYLNFPVLDKYSALIPSRQRAFKLVKQFENLLFNLVQNRSRHSLGEKSSPESDQVIHMLERALKEGKITEKQCRDNLKITFIVAHENIQLLLNSMLYQIGANQVSRARLNS